MTTHAPLSDIEIARAATAQPIEEIALKLDIPAKEVVRYGNDKAKIKLSHIETLQNKPDGKLILVTAITPTPAGEGKTTTTVGLGDGLNKIGKNAMICIREPSLGPCFGMKGGAAGGGHAQVIPMEDINLHFTGDFHAISAANNLLAAMIDNHIYWDNTTGLDTRRITWRRVMDMNDRSLRQITTSQGGVANGYPREGGFDITPASEVMACFCLATDLKDLRRRLGQILVGFTRDRTAVYARDILADGPMTALLKDAMMPNLVQTLEHNPAFIHGGPFANIAHGCNTVIATKTALKMADYVITEAGFGADLGAEKFFDIKCRKAGLAPHAAVLVATIRALKMHGGVAKADLGTENVPAVEKGLSNLKRHVENLRKFGVKEVVAINRFPTDTDAEIQCVIEECEKLGVRAIEATHWANGGAGTTALAQHVVDLVDGTDSTFRTLYNDDISLWTKIQTVAQEIYGASEIVADKKIRDQIKHFQDQGFGHYPVCIAKTQYSFSTDPNLKGVPTDHVVPIREVRLSNGAEFLLVVCGDIMTMPGLPRVPAANSIEVDEEGLVQGLF
ncbi:formate--tetrahydrofolate ligase [Paremcibacter congregatus]|uniref:Formate--tetrahydrofolate ligase n=1 Tax=Paremcibacter congregatus TaxID=2043170 RepID=A0A2G4YVA2_9PROT|nr:formate--tetrahydrofolate ligase [Paremcibacter congregatus]PHZ86259.1 formate--tetrahydrofolate ligase [Paremcibacter congregatus]QDE27226.1 formate--tetrahydrofolate ligase [Paremcibacter congregatus]